MPPRSPSMDTRYDCAVWWKMFFGHPLDTTQYQARPITGVTLESVLMRNAPTALTADYDNGNASFTMNANMAQAYKTVYSDYHTPEGTEPKEAPVTASN